ncbi:hypothetical protein B0H14DRAFT_3555534 [Mycena olivaceomarginata]|nr:hypothetical protein B0H14DRAFT_3555534 [Mycena olivaceomarginata]
MFGWSQTFERGLLARGSQIRGKTIEAFSSLFASHYGFERSVFAKTIAANKVKAENLLFKASVHYKVLTRLNHDPVLTDGLRDTTKRSGYAENKIISGTPWALFSLEITARNGPPGRGSMQASPRGMFMNATLSTSLTPRGGVITTQRSSKTFGAHGIGEHPKLFPITLTASTNIDQEQVDALRDELAGRTGETDSEIELDEPDEHDEPGPDVEEDP